MEELTVGTRIDHERYGEGIIASITLSSYEIFFARAGKMEISRSSDEIEVLESAEGTANNAPPVNLAQFEELMNYVLDKHAALQEEVPLGERWDGGTMELIPGKEGLQSKEIPIDAFFHKIVMVRDRLRVLEQNINSHEKLTDEEKVHLQQYITRCYGTLTTFNVLFADKAYYFSGSKK